MENINGTYSFNYNSLINDFDGAELFFAKNFDFIKSVIIRNLYTNDFIKYDCKEKEFLLILTTTKVGITHKILYNRLIEPILYNYIKYYYYKQGEEFNSKK